MYWLNNLRLNRGKSTEVIFVKSRGTRAEASRLLPPPLPGIARADHINMLGVRFSRTLSVREHVAGVIQSCAGTLYALKVLKAHGMPQESIQKVFQSTTLAKLLYASCSWFGFASCEDSGRMEAFLRKSVRLGFCRPVDQDLQAMCCSRDKRLFKSIISDSSHVLHSLLPPFKSHKYSLRNRQHKLFIPFSDNSFYKCNFITRMLLQGAYWSRPHFKWYEYFIKVICG